MGICVNIARRIYSPGHRFARPPSLPQAVKREEKKLKIKIHLPSFLLAKERVVQRSVDGVSPRRQAIAVIYLRECRSQNLLTRPSLRPATLSTVNGKEGREKY